MKRTSKRPPYKAGLIGCGYIGSRFNETSTVQDVYSHAAAYSTCPDTCLTAVCDVDPLRAQRCAQRWSVERFYTDYRTMLAEEALDIVSICTPDATHYEITQEVLRSAYTQAVLCEKPLATKPEDGWNLVKEAKDCGVLLSVNYSRRFDDGHQKARCFILEGKIGRVQTIRGLYTKGIIHNGTHLVDTIRFLTGDEIFAAQGYHIQDGSPGDPAIDAVLWCGDGYTAVLQACDAGHYNVFELDILGTRGRLSVHQLGHLILLIKPRESCRYPGYLELGGEEVVSGGMFNTTLNAVQNLADCLSGEAEPLCTAWDAAMDLSVVTAVKESAQKGQRIEIPKFERDGR